MKPDFAEAHNNLGNVLKDQGELDEAIACYRRAVQTQARLRRGPQQSALHAPFFSPATMPRRSTKNTAAGTGSMRSRCARFIRPHDNDRDPHRRLRVGYVSPDFRDHCQSFFTVPLLSAHDRQNFEIYGYADVARPDPLTERLSGLADRWRNIAGRTDEQVAEMVREDRIDILVDLTMHMAHNRLLVFARKPAPVQVMLAGLSGQHRPVDHRLPPDRPATSIRRAIDDHRYSRAVDSPARQLLVLRSAGQRAGRQRLCRPWTQRPRHLWLPEQLLQGQRRGAAAVGRGAPGGPDARDC